MPRADYWNGEYFQYWKQRVSEANNGAECSSVVAGDRTTVGDATVEEHLRSLEIRDGQTILDVGCGYGRLIPLLTRKATHVYGTDISAAMIQEARTAYGSLAAELRVEEAEKSSYPNAFFDRIVCWGVFDATLQAATAREILRLLKPGGRALATGKNADYLDDDEAALVAEHNARSKGHPNFFTDYASFARQLPLCGARILEERFYLRRGDFSANRFTRICPKRFYEYSLIFKKDEWSASSFSSFSSAYSATWLRAHPDELQFEAAAVSGEIA